MWLWASLILCSGTWELWLWPHCASSSAICLLMLHLLPELTQNLATEMGFLSAWVMICRRATAAVPEPFLFTSHPNSSRKFRKYNLFYASALRIPAFGLSDPSLGNQPPVMNPEWRAGNWNFPLLIWCHLRDPKTLIRTVSCCSAPISLLPFLFQTSKWKELSGSTKDREESPSKII